MVVSFFQESKTPFVLVCFLKITHFLHPLIRIKCSDDDVEEIYGLGYLPRLVYFEGGVPEPFVGDEQNIDEILKWIRDEMKSEEIKKVTKEILDKLKEKFDIIGTVFVDSDNKYEMKIIKELEKNISDIIEADLVIVQIDDSDYADQLGLTDPPTLVQFSGDVPNLYRGPETATAIIKWLSFLKDENTIEYVTEEILSELIEDEEYLAVFYSGQDCIPEKDDDEFMASISGDDDEDGTLTDCEKVLRGLESIDDELSEIGIAFVQTDNEDYPFRVHAISAFPALALYRNGEFLQYPAENNLQSEEEIRKWFMDEDNLLLIGKVEEVNAKMLTFLYENDDKLVVFFYEPTDRDADDIIDVLEQIDDLLDNENVSLVRINDEEAAEPYGKLFSPNTTIY